MPLYFWGGSVPPGLVGGEVGGSTGATDNRLLRADGTGGRTAQSSAVTLTDAGAMSGISELTVTGPVSASEVLSSGEISTSAALVGNSLLLGALTFLGFTSAAGAATTIQLPNSGDLAVHRNTSTGAIHLAYNDGGIIKTVQLT